MNHVEIILYSTRLLSRFSVTLSFTPEVYNPQNKMKYNSPTHIVLQNELTLPITWLWRERDVIYGGSLI